MRARRFGTLIARRAANHAFNFASCILGCARNTVLVHIDYREEILAGVMPEPHTGSVTMRMR